MRHMPDISRPVPAYVQIANHYRAAILTGELAPSARLPSVSDLAAEWNVATATAARAIGLLQVEGAVYTSPRGTFVADQEVVFRNPQDRVRTAARWRTTSSDETVLVTGVGIVPAPAYVGELLSLDPGDMVIRREEVTRRGRRPVMLSVDWVPGMDAVSAGELLSPEPIAGGVYRFAQRATGRRVTHERDYVRGRGADHREATSLNLSVGCPILAGTHIWSDDDGVVVYGEWVLPPDQVVSWEFRIDPDAVVLGE